jgi:hypothetical protein
MSTVSLVFYGVTVLNDKLLRWDECSVTDMNFMFDSASSFNGDLSIWDVSALNDMSKMFGGASLFNQDLCDWKDKFPYDSASNIFVSCPRTGRR